MSSRFLEARLAVPALFIWMSCSCDAATLYVGNFFGGTVSAFDAGTGASQGIFAAGISAPTGIAVGPDGNVYVAPQNSGDVEEFNGITGALIGTFASVGAPKTIGGIAFGNGDLYVVDASDDRIYEFNGTTGALITFATAIASGSPQAVAVGPDGSVYVSSGAQDSVVKFSADLSSSSTFASTSAFALGLTWGPDGDLYVGTTTGLERLSSSGTLLATWDPGVYTLEGIFTPSGLLLVSQSSANNIEQLNPTTGALMGVFASGNGLNGPFYMATTSAVPEPGTLGLAVLGALALVGAKARRS
jgi:DNA-binding beta-propeller fold protein YncE